MGGELMFTRLLDWLGEAKYNIWFPQRDYRKVLNWMPYQRKLVQLSHHRVRDENQAGR